jgi:hypothetical protein
MGGHYSRGMDADALASSLRIRARFNAQRAAQAREDALQAKARLLLNISSLILCEESLQEGEIIVSPRLYAAVKVLIAEDEAAKKRADATLAVREREYGGDSGTTAREGLPNLQEGKAVPGQSFVAGLEF